ncbi:type II toxin-antitoxin system HipA family toxin [Conservatibacter flavescens]|uniref:Type II toxin-antitoxin system HipA family toxin n=1 Tax=Conservatibacter flavescens TaxID=28161 RepID=A0A2M8S2X9_9PAST|nr:type II toxin-antitoxin system HipA family toxin [Conservatibacter flavescens]PJG85499.1 type II toxin-antitoxin system HipA family toxin [Conservatibacter flavescens]
MSAFEPICKLTVYRRLSDGNKVLAGQLAQNQQGVYFAYDSDYVSRFGNLSPFDLTDTLAPQLATSTAFSGLHGVFADSLPDGWGLMLQDRYFRTQGILPHRITPMDRLAFVGERGIGALAFEPVMSQPNTEDSLDLAELGKQAQAVFDGEIDELLKSLLLTGSSGGARPKAQIFMNGVDSRTCRTSPKVDDEAWIVKFTSKNLPLGHEEGLCEAAYLMMAAKAGLQPVTHQLIHTDDSHWLALKRFDYTNWQGRYHVHSVAGLLGLDFRLPALDYVDFIKLSRLLCKSSEVGKLQFRRAVFNLLTLNQDDHSKNFSFIQDDAGNWQPSPCYDITFSPTRFGEHSTAFAGFGKQVPKKAIEQLATQAGYDSWAQARADIEQVVSAIDFGAVSSQLGIHKQTAQMIQREINRVYQVHKAWLG